MPLKTRSAILIPCFVLLSIKSENKMVEPRRVLMYMRDEAAIQRGTVSECFSALTERES